MSEYDAHYVYVPLDYLQRLRAMDGRVTQIQIKLKDYRDERAGQGTSYGELFPDDYGYQVNTWEEKQGPLLAAIDIETGS